MGLGPRGRARLAYKYALRVAFDVFPGELEVADVEDDATLVAGEQRYDVCV
jgi:hypothetical protein